MHKWTAERIHDGHQFINEQVVITEDDGTVIDLCSKEAAGADIASFKGILCPGFVNTHCHVELSDMKGLLPEKTGLLPFLKQVISHGRRHTPPTEEKIREKEAAMDAAERAMIQKGIVAVGDISNTLSSLTQKAQGRLYYHTFVECMGLRTAAAEVVIEQGMEKCRRFKEVGLRATLVPHAPYSVSRELFERINETNRGLLTIHNQESLSENLLYQGAPSAFYAMFDELGLAYDEIRPTEETSLRSYLPWFTHAQPLLLVHNTCTQKLEIAEAMASGHAVYWCLCPNANWYIQEQLPPVEALRSLHAKITLGTDSLASNHQLSILAEMQCLQKGFPDLPLEEILCWATANGADALQCADTFGRLEKGKKPGLLLLENLAPDKQAVLPETTVKPLCEPYKPDQTAA